MHMHIDALINFHIIEDFWSIILRYLYWAYGFYQNNSK